MVNIIFKKKHDLYYLVQIQGHALFDKRGNDIVCAGISAITFGNLNTFSELIENCDIIVNNDSSLIEIKVNKSSENSELLFKALKIQFMTVYEQYKNYISIKEEN